MAGSPSGVTEQLKRYATRGVFREFSERSLGAARIEYRFVWLTHRPIHAVFNAKTNVLKIVDVLPGIAPRSTMDQALRAFLSSRFDSQLPAHRRLSKALVRRLECTNRNGTVSIGLTLGARKLEDATRQAVLLISEIFQNFLAGPYHEYMVLNFDLPED